MEYGRKRAWIDALLSGKYKQGVGTFKKIERVYNDEDGDYDLVTQHCCLGVLCEVAGIGHSTEGYIVVGNGNKSAFDESQAEDIGLPAEVQTALITFNDEQHMSFEFIAGYIEAKVPTEFAHDLSESEKDEL